MQNNFDQSLYNQFEANSIIELHIKKPKVLYPNSLKSIADLNLDHAISYQFTLDDIVILVVFSRASDPKNIIFLDQWEIGCKGEGLFLGLIDAILHLYNINKNIKNFQLSLREFEFYLRKSPKISLNLEENKHFVHFFDDFVKWIDQHILRDKLPFSQLTLAEKLVLVEKVVDEEYNLKFNKEGKLINVIDIEGKNTPEIIVEMKGIEGCSVGKELELLQNILIEKLGIEEVNIIPEV